MMPHVRAREVNMDNTRFVSERETTRILGVSVPAFRRSYADGFYPFRPIQVTLYRKKFLREEVENFRDAMLKGVREASDA